VLDEGVAHIREHRLAMLGCAVEAALGAQRVTDEETGRGPIGKFGRWLKANF
jgi:hypothetical protein